VITNGRFINDLLISNKGKKPQIITIMQKSATPVTYGILFNDCRTLKYLDLGERITHELTETETGIRAVLPARNNVYYGWLEHNIFLLFAYSDPEKRKRKSFAEALFGGFKSEKREGEIETFQEYKNTVLDAGSYGLADTLTNKVLISEKQLKRKNICRIDSLQVGGDGTLFGLVWNCDLTHSLAEIIEKSGKYSFGKELLNYGLKHDHHCQVIIASDRRLQKRAEKYNLSVVSCVNLHYLDINGKPVKGTEVEETQYMWAVEPLLLDGNCLEVIYSGFNFKQVLKAKIDLKNRKLIKKEVLVDSFPKSFDTFKLVQTKHLHEKLIGASKKIEISN